MEFERLRFEVSEGVARMTLSRPEAGNSIDMQLARKLLRAVLACDSDPEIRAVLLGAEGRAFCVGGDLRAFAGYADTLSAALTELTVYLHAALARLAHLEAPVVVAVGGVAAGAGMSLALSGDLGLAAESARFTTANTTARRRGARDRSGGRQCGRARGDRGVPRKARSALPRPLSSPEIGLLHDRSSPGSSGLTICGQNTSLTHLG